ncbi:MAG: ABC transporter permease [Thermomicrobiales bacterium]|nr:MAG: ABC transporter permease [Thermomicrobiales bacterium]
MSGRVADAVQMEETGAPASASHRGYFRRWRNPVLAAGLALLSLMLCFVIVGPMISPYSPTEPAFDQPTFADPSWSHPLGTDNFGRDTATRLAYGGRTDFVIAIVGTLLTVIVGLIIGLVAGFQGGKLDTLLMRVVDFTLALPYLVLVIGIIAVLGTAPTVIPGFGPLPVNVIFAIWLIGWVTYARLVRGEVLVAKNMEYVDAARVCGASTTRLILRHITPNVLGIVIIYAMADIVLNILLLSSLSFLGLGQQPPYPEWGLMVSEARDFFLRDWRMMTYPGLAVLITGAAFGLIGDGLNQALRPKG